MLNQSAHTINISSQGTISWCKKIAGTISTDKIQGFYCPTTGRIVFLRIYAVSNDTSQVYDGNLAEVGATDRMGGTFAEMSWSGEFSWIASK